MTSSANICATILGLTLALLIFSGVAQSQEGTAGTAGQSSSAYSGASGATNPSTINDATLKQTAKAFIKIKQIVQKANVDLSKTTDKAQQQQIAQTAESDKLAAVQAEGLQPSQYNQVIQLAQTDEAFGQKFLSYVNDVKKSSS